MRKRLTTIGDTITLPDGREGIVRSIFPKHETRVRLGATVETEDGTETVTITGNANADHVTK